MTGSSGAFEGGYSWGRSYGLSQDPNPVSSWRGGRRRRRTGHGEPPGGGASSNPPLATGPLPVCFLPREVRLFPGHGSRVRARQRLHCKPNSCFKKHRGSAKAAKSRLSRDSKGNFFPPPPLPDPGRVFPSCPLLRTLLPPW